MTELAAIGQLLQELEKVKMKLLNSPPGLRRTRHHRRPIWAGTASAGGWVSSYHGGLDESPAELQSQESG
jgi:hypothetical protein